MLNAHLDMFVWMSHVGKGTDARLFDAWAMRHGTAESAKIRLESRTFLKQLRRLGHIYRPEVSEKSWTVFGSSLVIRNDLKGAFWCGALDYQLLSQLKLESTSIVTQNSKRRKDAPPYIGIVGIPEALEHIASKIGLRLVRNVPLDKASGLRYILSGLSSSDLPHTQNKFFNSVQLPFPGEVFTFHPPNAPRRYFVRLSESTFAVPSQEIGVFVAAAHRHKLCHYEHVEQKFISKHALPLEFEVPLIMCTGELPTYSNGVRTYNAVPFELAEVTLQKLGQDRFVPRVHWLR